MNYEAAIEYARQRMRELNKQANDYHFEPVYIAGTKEERAKGKITFNAYNEVYILVNHQNYFGLLILADNIMYNTEDPFNSGVHEFTGRIEIRKITEQWSIELEEEKTDKVKITPVEFLRVVIY